MRYVSMRRQKEDEEGVKQCVGCFTCGVRGQKLDEKALSAYR